MNPMIEKMTTRHAIRRFQNRQVEEEALQEILTAGLYAPSAGNNQYSRIVVCQDPDVNLKLGKLSRPLYLGRPAQYPGRFHHSGWLLRCAHSVDHFHPPRPVCPR